MATITLKVPDEVNASLDSESARRRISKSALVREAIEQTLQLRQQRQQATQQWLRTWSGALAAKGSRARRDARLDAILSKHLK